MWRRAEATQPARARHRNQVTDATVWSQAPTVLLVLLGAVGLGRTWFGVGLALAYGLGMAATLTAAGLLLLGLRDRPDRFRPSDGLRRRTARLVAGTPVLTALLVLVVGIGLTARGVAGSI